MTVSLYKQINLKSIKLHADVPTELISSYASLTYRLSRNNRLSKTGLVSFIKIHPLHVIKQGKSFKCFAGIRGYQLAEKILSPQAKISVIVHSSININIEQESSVDALLSTLIFGLDDLAYETDFLNIWKAVDSKQRKRILPGLNNKSYLETLLKCSRSGLSRKSKKLISQLKKEINKEVASDDQ